MADIAQLVQQRTENPRITGSNLILATIVFIAVFIVLK